jgi:hypothetical protein
MSNKEFTILFIIIFGLPLMVIMSGREPFGSTYLIIISWIGMVISASFCGLLYFKRQPAIRRKILLVNGLF